MITPIKLPMKHTKQITTRLTENEYLALMVVARAERCSVSALVRDCVMREAATVLGLPKELR